MHMDQRQLRAPERARHSENAFDGEANLLQKSPIAVRFDVANLVAVKKTHLPIRANDCRYRPFRVLPSPHHDYAAAFIAGHLRIPPPPWILGCPMLRRSKAESVT